MKVKCLVVGAFQENCYLACQGNHAIVIDPGDDPTGIIEEIQKNHLILDAIVCTHAHLDHVGAVEKLMDATGAPFCLHEADATMLHTVPTQALMFGLSAAQPPKPTRLLKEGDVITADSLTLEVIHTPGHTPGGICLKGEGVIFTGDTLFAGSIGRTDLPGGNHQQIIQSIKEKLMPLDDATIVYPGHGAESTIGNERRNNPFL